MSALSPAHVVTLVPQLYGGDGEVQDPAVGRILEGELSVKPVSIEVDTSAVQLSGLALLVLQALRIQAVPLQLLVGIIVCAADERHCLLLQGIL